MTTSLVSSDVEDEEVAEDTELSTSEEDDDGDGLGCHSSYAKLMARRPDQQQRGRPRQKLGNFLEAPSLTSDFNDWLQVRNYFYRKLLIHARLLILGLGHERSPELFLHAGQVGHASHNDRLFIHFFDLFLATASRPVPLLFVAATR